MPLHAYILKNRYKVNSARIFGEDFGRSGFGDQKWLSEFVKMSLRIRTKIFLFRREKKTVAARNKPSPKSSAETLFSEYQLEKKSYF